TEQMKNLFSKYINNKISLSELRELMDYFSKPEHRSELTELINLELAANDSTEQSELVRRLVANLDDHVLSRVKALAEAEEVRGFRRRARRRYIRVAAAIAMLMTIGATLYFYGRENYEAVLPDQLVDIRPGGNRAMLTLASGETINLDSTEAGISI